MLGGWPCGAIYRSSAERNAALAGWLDFYDRRRSHGALSHKPPIARLNELNNLLGSYTQATKRRLGRVASRLFVGPGARSSNRPQPGAAPMPGPRWST